MNPEVSTIKFSNNKTMRKSLLLLLAPLVFAIASCKKKDENNLTPEQVQEAKLIASQWKATGIFATGSTTPLQTVNLTLDFKDGNGTSTNVDNTIIVNGVTSTPLATQWKVNADGTVLSMKIPSATSILSSGFSIEKIVTAVLTAPTTDFKITLSDTDLTIIGESGKDINLFGIPLPAGAELRFNKTGAAAAAPTNSNLTAVTWKGEGFYTKDAMGNFVKSGADASNVTMKFGTNALGFNTVAISGITAPVTWSIDDATNPTKVTLIFPKIGNTEARTAELLIKTLTATNLDFEATNDVNIVITTIKANNQLRMIPQ